MSLSSITKNLRFKIVKVLAPKFFQDYMNIHMEKRSFINQLKGKNLIGAEIGVYRGENAYKLLSKANIKKLYLIDSYYGYNRQVDYDFAYSLLKHFYGKFKFIIKSSHETKNMFALNSLDFVYIDGDHSFNGCLQDLIDYYPLVKNGGIIGGHDFDSSYLGVIKAVVLFCAKHNIDFNVQEREFWIKKEIKK